MTLKEKPACTCGHPHIAHRLGICAHNKGRGIPDSCFCDSYEPMDNDRLDFPVEVIPHKEDDDPK